MRSLREKEDRLTRRRAIIAMTIKPWDKCVCGHAFDLHDPEQREYCQGTNTVEYPPIQTSMGQWYERGEFPCKCILFKRHNGMQYGELDLA
jgi:hypothetical protein